MRLVVKPREEWGRSFFLPRPHSSLSFGARFRQNSFISDLFVVVVLVVRLWEAGWKGRYYKNKFELSEDDEEYDDFRKKVVRYIYIVLFCINILCFSVSDRHFRKKKKKRNPSAPIRSRT